MVTETNNKTKESILGAAERLFAEQGFEVTTLRDITSAAGVNLALVNYHFGSKSELLRAVLQRAITTVKTQQSATLTQLEQRQPAITLEEILGAFITPMFTLFHQPEQRGRIIVQIFARAMIDPNQEIQDMILEIVGDSDERFVRLLQVVLPDLSKEEIWWRFTNIFGILITQQVGLLTRLRPASAFTNDEQLEYRRMIEFLQAGFRAPAMNRDSYTN